MQPPQGALERPGIPCSGDAWRARPLSLHQRRPVQAMHPAASGSAAVPPAAAARCWACWLPCPSCPLTGSAVQRRHAISTGGSALCAVSLMQPERSLEHWCHQVFLYSAAKGGAHNLLLPMVSASSVEEAAQQALCQGDTGKNPTAKRVPHAEECRQSPPVQGSAAPAAPACPLPAQPQRA